MPHIMNWNILTISLNLVFNLKKKAMSVVGMFRTHLTTQVGSDGKVDEHSPDDQIKFFETTNPDHSHSVVR